MAMYYYASKLNEASCSGCKIKVPSAPSPVEPSPPSPLDSLPLSESALIGTGLSFYDNDDYYSMVRGSNFLVESGVTRLMMNGGLNLVTAQKIDPSQLPTVLQTKSLTIPFMSPDKPDVEYKDGQIVSATIDGLIDLLRPGATKTFIFTFLLCSRLFTRQHELLNKLCKRYFKNYEKVGKVELKELADKEVSEMVGLVRVLDQWTTMFPYDFRDERVMAIVKNITQRCSAEHMSSVRVEVSSMLESLLEKLTALERYEETLVHIPQYVTADALPQGDILTLGLTPVELANQLTIVELHRLSFVGPEELIQTFAPNQPSSSAKGLLHHLENKCTKNLEAYADWFNRLSYLVATDILKSIKSKYRARVLEQWVMTARECFNLGNFNSLMSIISALNMSPITRIKKTWGRTTPVCVQQLKQLELCVEPSGNHARYRAALAAAPTETAVPLLSVTCRDLHFANQGSPIKMAGNRLNFAKCSLVARHVSSQLAGRRLCGEGPAPVNSPPHIHPPAWRFLTERPTLTEQGLELTSFEREPPVDQLEKERLKRLRLGT